MKKLPKIIQEYISTYFDRNIPQWLKTKRALRKEIKKRFIEAIKEEIQKQIKEQEDLMLYGDPSLEQKPIGIIHANKEKL